MVRRWFTRLSALSAVVAIGLIVGWLLTPQQAACVSIERVDWDLQQYTKFDMTVLWIGRGQIGVIQHATPLEPTVKQTDWTIAFGKGMPPIARGSNIAAPIPLWVPIVAAAILPVAWLLVRRLREHWWTNALRHSWRRSLGRATFVLSLLALTLSILFCIRSYPYFERFDLRLRSGIAAMQVNSSLGSLMVAWTESGPNHTLSGEGQMLFVRSTIPPDRGPLYKAADLIEPYSQALGFTFGSDGTTRLWRNVLIVPYWFVIFVSAFATFVSARSARRRARKDGDLERQGFDVEMARN